MALLDLQTAAPELLTIPKLSIHPDVSRARLAEALAALPEADSLMLAMFYVEGLSLGEVALVLDRTASDVLTQYQVACTMIRGLTRSYESAVRP